MSAYRIEFTHFAAQTFRKLDPILRERITAKIDSLASNPRPHGVEKLAGQEGRYRVRVGNYRIIFAISDADRLIEIAVIGHRREVYR